MTYFSIVRYNDKVTNRHTDKRRIVYKKILVDFAVVLNIYGKEENFNENIIPEIKNGAKEFLKELSIFGELYLFTTINQKLAAKWLIHNDIDKYFKDITNIKIPAY